MDRWALHWLEASGSLDKFRDEVIGEFEAAYKTVSRLITPPRLDVLIQRLPGETIPEMGLMGRAYRSTMFCMTIDPDNPNWLPSLRNGALHRQIIHEVHHCLRMAGPGYGWTLGEALVSEGLAGQFVRHLLGSDPEPWENALNCADLLQAPADLKDLQAAYYNHSEWFFGSGAHPKWLGYALGYQMVGRWLASVGDIDAATWINVPAADIVASAVEEGYVLLKPRALTE